MKSRFENTVDNILKETSKKSMKSILLQEEEKNIKKEEKNIKKEEQKTEENKSEKEQNTNIQINEKQNEFLQKFIKYSELLYLNESTEKIIQDFKRVLKDNDSIAIQMINKNKQDREKQIQDLIKELNGLRKSLQDEAKKAEAKVSLLELLGDTTDNEQIKSPIQ